MIKKFDHVALAVKDAEDAVKSFSKLELNLNPSQKQLPEFLLDDIY